MRARGDPLWEVSGLAQQDAFDVLRVKQNVKMKMEEVVVDNVAVVAGPTHESPRRVAAGHERGAHNGKAPRPGRAASRGCGGSGRHEQETPRRRDSTHDTPNPGRGFRVRGNRESPKGDL